ncbi:MAG: hypothetical protein NT105_03735 [Verrucomicrobia bacterium]|nr:hypothetical protein [Verrucomicrobiota bacterium]
MTVPADPLTIIVLPESCARAPPLKKTPSKAASSQTAQDRRRKKRDGRFRGVLMLLFDVFIG